MSLLSPRQVQVASGAGRLRRWLLVLGGLLLVLVALVGTQSGRVRLGAQAYVYGYPLVIMDVTRQHASQTAGPENELRRVRRFPDARFKAVVRPNVDTLYTTAFIDMVQGPWLFEMAPNGQRYELMPFMDAWTNVFATPGTRTERAGRARYSLPFFLHFAPDFVIRTLPGCIDKARPDRYPEAISADAFLQQRLREIGLLGDG